VTFGQLVNIWSQRTHTHTVRHYKQHNYCLSGKGSLIKSKIPFAIRSWGRFSL